MTTDQIIDIKSALANADALDKQAQWTREQCRKICDHTNADGSSAVETPRDTGIGWAPAFQLCSICRMKRAMEDQL